VILLEPIEHVAHDKSLGASGSCEQCIQRRVPGPRAAELA
jgi:hypothetical protein